MTVLAYRHESKWARRHRIRRMVDKRCMPQKGVTTASTAWRTAALAIGLTALNAVLFVRLWL